MKYSEISKALDEGRFVVWVDDKESALTPEYIEVNFIAVVDTLEDGYDLCSRMQEKERRDQGRATTRYRVSSRGKDYVCSEDMDHHAMIDILNKMPIDEKQKWRVVEQLKKRGK